MKKLFCLILSVCFCFAFLAGCANQGTVLQSGDGSVIGFIFIRV